MRSTDLNVLLIDDDKDFIGAVADQLREEFGYKTSIVPNPKQAIEVITSTTKGIDAILVDYEMPEMNGLEFLRWMKEQKNQTPVIMLTAAGSEVVAVEAMKLGAYDYVKKEHLDLNHLSLTLEATSERHQYRVMKEMDQEQLHEMILNSQATDKARDVLNAITPPLNSALANIDFEVEVKGEELLQTLDPSSQAKVRGLLQEVLKEIRVLEMSVRGLLMLYRIFYAHHDEEKEIEEIRRDVEASLKARKKS